ncbi:MAG: TIGR04283 family arsenosugar biosynthesis glycosyltransferase [Verrucomicrobiota bacterium]
MSPAISIIIPTQNEADHLPATLSSLPSESLKPEVIVVDANSSDETLTIAREAGCHLITSPAASRAKQQNLGAAHANAPVLLFLHADTRLPPTALDQITAALKTPANIVGGAFARYFDSPSLILKLTCKLALFRSRYFHLFLGDQAIFVRRHIFHQINGFDESLSQCEDLDFSLRLRQIGPTTVLSPPVRSSDRRFRNQGPLKTTLKDFTTACSFLKKRKE